MASAVRSRAAAVAKSLVLHHRRSFPSSRHHLLPLAVSSGANGVGDLKLRQQLEDSPFIIGQSVRHSSRTTLGLLLGESDDRQEFGDSFAREDGRVGQESIAGRKLQDRKRYSTSIDKKSESDGEAFAKQMIGYAGTQRKDVTMHVEACRVLEQGYNFLRSQGPSAANAAAKVLLTLATFHVDGGKLQDAVSILQQIPLLDGASAEVGVSASQALAGVFLRMHKDSLALVVAQSMVGMVNEANGLPPQLMQELKFRAAATVQFVEHATSSKTSGNLLDMSSLSLWLNDKEAQVEGVAAAIFGIAECHHIRGHFSEAKDYYEKASALAESSLEKDSFGSNAAAMTADEVLVRAEAGLGQAASHLGDFDDAEKYLTKALTRAEQINGEKHPRVGTVLTCLADVYAQRGLMKGIGDITLTEGLYRKATNLLGAPPLDTPGQDLDMIDLGDVVAIARARYAALLLRANKRESEAQKLQAGATALWRGPRSLTDVLAQEASTQPAEPIVMDKEPIEDAYSGRYVVIDVGLGRVLFTPTHH